MKRLLTDAEMERVSVYIAEQMGLHFPPSKWPGLEQSFSTAARELGFKDMRECISWFTSPPPTREIIESMACYLTIGETYFLRERGYFEVFEKKIIPEIIGKRRGNEQRLRIWSAGCATGEEAYSIAILLDRISESLRNWDISILATDINPHALSKAREGVYTEWSFRTPSRWLKENYFDKTGDGRYRLIPRIRRMVDFSSLNLAEDLYPSLVNNTNAMDVIFCRNVLMYFTPELAERVIERFRLCLVDGGWLFVSPCENSQLLSSRFKVMSYPDAIIYRKQEPGIWDQGIGIGDQESAEVNLKPTGPGFLPPLPVSRDIQTPAFVSKSSTFTPQTPTTAPVPPPAHLTPYEVALTLYGQGLYAEAAERLTAHLSPDSGDAAAIALLCRIRANEGRLGEALRLSEQAIAADKMNAGLHYLRAVILQEQGDGDEAVTTLKRALYLDQELILAHFSLGNLALRQGKEKESRRYFNNTLALLKRYRPDEIVPESDGMLAGRLMEIIESSAKPPRFQKPRRFETDNLNATWNETRRFIR